LGGEGGLVVGPDGPPGAAGLPTRLFGVRLAALALPSDTRGGPGGPGVTPGVRGGPGAVLGGRGGPEAIPSGRGARTGACVAVDAGACTAAAVAGAGSGAGAAEGAPLAAKPADRANGNTDERTHGNDK
jgi:hypothetical protein